MDLKKSVISSAVHECRTNNVQEIIISLKFVSIVSWTIWATTWQNQQSGICPVWSESSLSAWRKLGSLTTHWVHSEDSDQTGQADLSLLWAHSHFVGFVMMWLIYNYHLCAGGRDWQNHVRIIRQWNSSEMYAFEIANFDLKKKKNNFCKNCISGFGLFVAVLICVEVIYISYRE